MFVKVYCRAFYLVVVAVAAGSIKKAEPGIITRESARVYVDMCVCVAMTSMRSRSIEVNMVVVVE
jgi:hypothetical protein